MVLAAAAAVVVVVFESEYLKPFESDVDEDGQEQASDQVQFEVIDSFRNRFERMVAFDHYDESSYLLYVLPKAFSKLQMYLIVG